MKKNILLIKKITFFFVLFIYLFLLIQSNMTFWTFSISFQIYIYLKHKKLSSKTVFHDNFQKQQPNMPLTSRHSS